MDNYGVKSEESQTEEQQPHAECSKKQSEGDESIDANKSEPLKILLETREKRGLPCRKNSECSCQQSQNSLGTCSASPSIGLQSNSLHSISSQVYHSSLSCGSTISGLTESQTSGYTTESSYQTATERDSTLTYSIYDDTYRRMEGMLISNNQLQEIHVSIGATESIAQTQAIYESLQNLLSNEIELIRVLSDGSREAVYVIAYSLM